MTDRSPFLFLLTCTVAATVTYAQPARTTAPQAAQVDQDAAGAALDEIVITSRREMGAVIGDITPETQLSAEEIRALGVGSVSELLAVLGPQLGSSRGRGGAPVVLINGIRVSGFGEVRDIPSEAILRTDILPEEVALKYGYRADQRVVNIVLRPRFRGFTGEAGVRDTTEGGREAYDLNGNWLRIRRDERWQVDLKARREEELLESERRIVGVGGTPKPDAAFRSLAPQNEQLTANVVIAKPLAEGLSATINASLDDSQRISGLGVRSLAAGPLALQREADSLDTHVGGIVQGTQSGWRWSISANADRNDSSTRIPGDGASGQSRTDIFDIDLVANGTPFDLPAGAASLTAKVGAGSRGIESTSTRGTTTTRADLSRDQRDLQVSLDLPIWRGEGELEQLGTISFNANQAVEHVSDVGSLQTSGFGLNWSMDRKFRVTASITDEEGAPSMQQLGGALIASPFARTFDFVRGETVDITRIDGGNPLLEPDQRKVFKIGVGSRPIEGLDLDLNGDYVRTQARNIASPLVAATPELERAFPSRYTRDADGRLLAIDARPINLAARDREELRFTVNLSRPWGPQPEAPFPPGRGGGNPAGGGNASGGSNPAGGGAGASGSAPPADDAARRARMAQMGERFLSFARRGSVQLSLTYTERLADELTIAPQLPELDLLDGESLFDSPGTSRRELELQLGANRNGIGARLITQWRSASTVKGNSTGTGLGDLDFSSLTTVNLRLFADLGLQPWARNHAFLRGARMSVVVGNLFNERRDVRAADGSVPINYQPDLLDPQGRNVRITFRKLFFPAFTPPAGRTG